MKYSPALFLAFLLFFLSVPAYAHPGGTDASGCHTNKETGEYHCHGAEAKSARTEARTTARTEARGQSSGGECGSDSLNCSDFSSFSQAQAIFEKCLEQAGRDVHGLDGDNDGEACESLK